MTEWRKVSGWPYEVSSEGQVRSKFTMRPLAGGVDKDGYRKIVLCSGDGERGYARVSALVCIAFHGPRLPGMVVRHLDGSRDNDAAENLRWSTQAENIADKVRHGTAQRGEQSGTAKLTRAVVLALRELESVDYDEWAAKLGVGRTCIWAAHTGRSWKHL